MKSRRRHWMVVCCLSFLGMAPLFAADIAIFEDSIGEGEGKTGSADSPALTVNHLVDELEVAESLGHTVTLLSEAEWSAMTTGDFAAFDALVIGDNGCSGDFDATLGPVNDNKAVWSPAVTGNIIIHAFDHFAHHEGDGELLVANGIGYAASGPGTGLYISTGCYADADDDLDLMSEFGTFSYIDDSDDDITIVDASHPVMAGITQAGLEDWGDSVHAEFTSVPSDFMVLATETDTGNAVIIVRDAGVDAVPSLSGWAMITLTLLLGAAGVVAVRRW